MKPVLRQDPLRLLALGGLALISIAGLIAVGIAGQSTPPIDGFDPGFSVAFGAALALYWGLGAVIVLRADGHLVGWLFALSAAMIAAMLGSFALASIGEVAGPGDPFAPWGVLVGAALITPVAVLSLPAVAIVFPTGHLPGRGWRWPVGMVASLVVVRTAVIVLRPGIIDGDTTNPLTPWLPAMSPEVAGLFHSIEDFGALSIVLAAGLGVVAVAVRVRRSRGDEHQQLKWFLAAVSVAAIVVPLSMTDVASSLPFLGTLSIASLGLIPVTVAIAIVRYRLYDIDRIISRTISYGLITAFLLAVFLAASLGLQTLLSSVTSTSSLAVAGSTLLVTGLFSPARRRVQRVVDRRFDRARYDGERSANAFATRMRDVTDLSTVAVDLDATIRRALAPSKVGVWLRSPDG